MKRLGCLLLGAAIVVSCTPAGDDDDDDDNVTPIFQGLVTNDVDPTQFGAGVESPWLYGGEVDSTPRTPGASALQLG